VSSLTKHSPKDSALRRYVDNVMHAPVAQVPRGSDSGLQPQRLGERVLVNVQAVVEETIELLNASLPCFDPPRDEDSRRATPQ